MSRLNRDTIGTVTTRMELRAGPDDAGRRLDRVVRRALPGLALSAIHRMFRKGDIRVDGKRADPEARIHAGSLITVRLLAPPDLAAAPASKAGPPDASRARALLAPMEILMTEDLLFLDKPAGMLVHDGAGSLQSIVLEAFPDAGGDSLSFTPGPLHRLDRNTSGLIAFSLSLRGAHAFTEALRAGVVAKTYLAILSGELDAAATWEDDLERDGDARITRGAGSAGSVRSKGARHAVTAVEPLARRNGLTFARVSISTGRTHQIRAHGALHGHPLAGDSKYGSSVRPLPGCGIPYFLHALSLSFRSTIVEGMPDSVVAPPGRDLVRACRELFGVDPARLFGPVPS